MKKRYMSYGEANDLVNNADTLIERLHALRYDGSRKAQAAYVTKLEVFVRDSNEPLPVTKDTTEKALDFTDDMDKLIGLMQGMAPLLDIWTRERLAARYRQTWRGNKPE